VHTYKSSKNIGREKRRKPYFLVLICILRQKLAKGPEGIGRRFFRAAGLLIDISRQIAVGSDLQHERVEGKRTAQVRLVNWYIAKLFRSANRDPILATKFLEVANLMKTPSTLLKPAVALRVWKGQLLT